MGVKKATIGAGVVLQLLEESPRFARPACAWFREVRDGSGYSNKTQGRYADGLVCSLWPSRGIWLGGIEVKVSRSDWLKELSDPTKSAAVQRYCDYWWVAAPDGVVLPGEVPEQWGHLVVQPDASKTKRVVETKAAPRLSPQPWSAEFLASVMRNMEAQQRAMIADAKHEERTRLAAEFSQDAVNELKVKLMHAESKTRDAEARLEIARAQETELRAGIARFEADAGLPPGSVHLGSDNRWVPRPTNGALFKALRELQRDDVAGIAARLETAAKDLKTALELGKVAAE